MRNLFCVLIVCALLSCADDAADELLSCGVKGDIIEKVEWLNMATEDIRNNPEINGVVLYRYGGREVIEIQRSQSSSTNQSQFGCDGTKLDFDDHEKFKDYLDHRVELRVLFGKKIWE